MINNIILKIRSGSHLYGTNTETSDEDYVGVFIPEPKYLIGLHKVEQVDESTKVKLDSGKNAPEAVDATYYSLEKFCKLALDNNPNILELLFANQENLVPVEFSYIGEQLLSLRKLFVSKLLKHRFLGYAFSQRHKMVIKLENYERIIEAVDYLKYLEEKDELKYILDINSNPIFTRTKDFIHVGDVNLPATITIKKAREMLEMRQKKFGSRKELVEKFNYDVKFGSHLIRLILEGIELLQTGELLFPLQYKDLLLGIRQGKYSLNEVIKLSEEKEKIVEEYFLKTTLPHSPDFNTIEQFVIKIHKEFL